tara:strand:- start:252 stop:485 length:234 start_codon:yes stop_codon:yes gene_type:complete
MAEQKLTEQQGHLQSILKQQQDLANEINQLNAQLTSKKELFNKTQGVVEYLNTIGVKLPEAEAPAEETTTAPTEVVK